MIRSYRKPESNRWRVGLLSVLAAATWLQIAGEAMGDDPVAERPPFATVGEVTITAEQFEAAVQNGMRQKFYHGKVPEVEFAKYQKEVGEYLIDRILLRDEIKRRGIPADHEGVKQAVDQYDKRYASSERWHQNREKMLEPLIKELEEKSQLKQLEQQVRKLPEPVESEVLAYYKAHPEKFTQPEQRKLSLILLKVDPGGGPEAWESARKEAVSLLDKLKKGADFGELARIHSGDPSAEKGGEMETVHKGSLAVPAEEAISKLKEGQLSDPPVMVLEGISIFRLNQILPKQLMTFEEVKDRAAKLLIQERSNQAWDGLKKRLRAEKKIKINNLYYKPVQEGGKITPQNVPTGKAR